MKPFIDAFSALTLSQEDYLDYLLNQLITSSYPRDYVPIRRFIFQKGITHINLSGKFKDGLVLDLKVLLVGTPVRSVDLSSNRFGPKTAREIALELKSTNVDFVDISNNLLCANGAIAFIEALTDSRVKGVNLSSNEINDLGAKGLGFAVKNSQINILIIKNNGFTAKGTREFIDALDGGKLEVLDISDNTIGKDGARYFAETAKKLHLKRLKVEDTDIDAALKEFTEGLHGSAVEWLDISSIDLFQSSRIKDLTTGLHGTRVKHLFVREASLTAVCAIELVTGLRGTLVTEIDFGSKFSFFDGNVIMGDLKKLGESFHGTMVTEVDLSNNRIGMQNREDGPRNLAEGLRGTLMRRVHLSKNSLCSSAIKNLFSSFKGTNVIELSLDNNNISYADLKELSQQVDGTCLIRVKTSEPCYQLQEALKKNLQKLNLAHYYATDLHNLHGLTPEEKAKHQGVGIATPQNELSYAGGILMDEALPARAREIIQGYLPLMRGHLGHGLKKEKKQDQTSEEKEAESRTGCAIM